MVQVTVGALLLWYLACAFLMGSITYMRLKQRSPLPFHYQSHRVLFVAACLLWPLTLVPFWALRLSRDLVHWIQKG